jgi:hypothetical protein
VAAACLLASGSVWAADNEAGVPLSPGDAAGAWTLQSQGHAVCVVRLGARKAPGGFALRLDPQCAGALPQGAAAWRPTADGMAMTGSDGSVLIAFGRWSNSLFVSHRSSGSDLQLKRGLPGATPGNE